MNKKRVQFLRKLIYAFIIIVFFLPLILMSLLALRMISVSQTMQEQLQTLTSAISQPAQSSSQGGYVLDPKEQSVNGESLKSQTIDGTDTKSNIDDLSSDVSSTQTEDNRMPSSEPIGTDNKELTINDVGNNTLNELTGGNTSTDMTSGIDGNPDTGAPLTEDVSPPNYNGNPGMGC